MKRDAHEDAHEDVQHLTRRRDRLREDLQSCQAAQLSYYSKRMNDGVNADAHEQARTCAVTRSTPEVDPPRHLVLAANSFQTCQEW